jgi:hypothetical protein
MHSIGAHISLLLWIYEMYLEIVTIDKHEVAKFYQPDTFITILQARLINLFNYASSHNST